MLGDNRVASSPTALGSGHRLRLLWRVLATLFFAGVAALIVARARQVDWSAVLVALRSYSVLELGLALLVAALGHACAACYDLIGRRYTGHLIPASRVFTINAIVYAFSLNLGALVGSWAFRVRLYTRFGLPVSMVARIIVLAVVTNWAGFTLIGGVLLALWPPQLPASWEVPSLLIRAIGVLLLGVVGAYLAACAHGHRRGWAFRVRGQSMRLPSLPMAIAQLLLSAASWLLMAIALALLLPADLSFAKIVESLFASSIAGAMLHVPGNVGVLEGSFSALMSRELAVTQALAGVLAFRAVYFIVPFLFASAAYAVLELLARRHRKTKV